MTVEELIDHLTQFPPDAPVVYRYASDWSVLEAADIELHRAEERKIIRHPNIPGDFMDVSYLRGQPKPEQEFVTVLCFPGN